MNIITIEALKEQLSELIKASLKAKVSGDQESHQVLKQICKLLTFSIQLKEGTLNTRSKINKVWDVFYDIHKMSQGNFAIVDQEELAKSFIYDIFSVVYEQYSLSSSIQPKALLEKTDLNALSAAEKTLIEKYTDPVSKTYIEFPICITEENDTQTQHYYFDLKTVMCACINNIGSANKKIENSNDYALDELFPLLYAAFEDSSHLSWINPLTGQSIMPNSINVVEEGYVATLQQLQSNYPLMTESESNARVSYRS